MMEQQSYNEFEVASKSVIKLVSKQFAEAFTETPQYMAFEQAYYAYRKDEKTQKALQEFQEKQASLQALLMLNAISEEDRVELTRLRDQFYNQPSILEYTKAQTELAEISQRIGDMLSEAIGLDFGASCRTGGCCG